MSIQISITGVPSFVTHALRFAYGAESEALLSGRIAGVQSLSEGVSKSSSLTKLIMAGNNLDTEGKAALQDAVRSKKGFKLLI